MWLLAISVWDAPRQATASEAYQQRRERISVSFRNASLAEVLQRIKQQTGYYIIRGFLCSSGKLSLSKCPTARA